MIANIRNSQVRKLCTLAAGDELALQFPLPDFIFGFHAQQSCEKLLKALIATHNRIYPFTHRLADLVTLLEQAGEILPQLTWPFTALESYAVLMRYDFEPSLSDSDRNEVREAVKALREHVIARILQVEMKP